MQHVPHGAHHIANDAHGQNFYAIDRQFQDLMRLYMEPGLREAMTPHFDRLGALAGGRLDELAETGVGRGQPADQSVDAARKITLALSAACMPWVMLAPMTASIAAIIAIFSLAFFGQQSWSTLVMTLPTDLAPRSALGRLAGLVGLGGAFGGIVMGQAAGWALDAGFGYTPVLTVAATLHLIAFALICLSIPRISRLTFMRKAVP